MEDVMRQRRMFHRVSYVAAACILMFAGIAAQSVHEAPPGAAATGRLASSAEPGQRLRVSGVVVGRDGARKPKPAAQALSAFGCQGRMVVRNGQAGFISKRSRPSAYPLRSLGWRS